MSTAFIDHVSLLNSAEKNGVVRSLTRRARVRMNPIPSDYTVLWSALQAAGIPSVPSTLSGTGFEALLLEERRVALVDEDQGFVDVDLTYNHVLDGTQELPTGSNPTVPFQGTNGVSIYGRTRCSLVQKQTNQIRDYTQPGAPFVPITVQYTYPPTHPFYAQFPNGTAIEGGEVTTAVPQKNYQFSGYLSTFIPWIYADFIIGHVNEFIWMQGAPRTWMCTEVQWEIVKTGRYKFMFEFQHDPDTWDPWAVFIDQYTGYPPPDLTLGVGKKLIQYADDVDFNDYFSAFFESSWLNFP